MHETWLVLDFQRHDRVSCLQVALRWLNWESWHVLRILTESTVLFEFWLQLQLLKFDLRQYFHVLSISALRNCLGSSVSELLLLAFGCRRHCPVNRVLCFILKLRDRSVNAIYWLENEAGPCLLNFPCQHILTVLSPPRDLIKRNVFYYFAVWGQGWREQKVICTVKFIVHLMLVFPADLFFEWNGIFVL